MRILLGAVQCEKGDVSGNLARHVELMRVAHRAGCELAVFPELSLTGSVDPMAQPDHALALDHPAVAELVDATAAVRVGAVFGLAEHRDDGFFITQAYAASGELFGVQRKRHLGDGEEAYTASSETPMRGRWFTQYERWYLSRCQHFDVDPATVAGLRQEGIRDMRWWSPEEIEAEQIRTGPRDLPDLLRQVKDGHLPDPGTDLGF